MGRPVASALLAGALAGLPLAAQQSRPAQVFDDADRPALSARYVEPTTRYDHGVLGDAVEWGAIEIEAGACRVCGAATGAVTLLRLPENRVFEDVAPRVVDADGSGWPVVMVVETDADLGARLALYSGHGQLRAATPFIGQARRWLSPVGQGVGDLDGDGYPEIAYVDRPHLARTLRVWRFDGVAMMPVASLDGVTNHRIGEDYITGGFRRCGPVDEAVDEAIVVSADWTRIIAVTLADGALIPRDIGAFFGRDSVDAALACR